jgi:sugar phosphate isomerase/epimerase
MWQDMDVIEVIRCLGREEAIYHVHAKDTCSGITQNTWGRQPPVRTVHQLIRRPAPLLDQCQGRGPHL